MYLQKLYRFEKLRSNYVEWVLSGQPQPIFSTPNILVETPHFLEFSEISKAEVLRSAKVAFIAQCFTAFKSMPNISTGGV